MNINQLDYHLPENLIAQTASVQRDRSRLLVLKRPAGALEHRRFADIIDYINPGDCLVINNSKVIPARFFLRRSTGGRIEGLFLKLDDNLNWHVMLRAASRLKPRETVHLADPHHDYNPLPEYTLRVIDNFGEGAWLLEPLFPTPVIDTLLSYGLTPLPPYIQRQYDRHAPGRETADRDRYQTVYASVPGSVAAPTAGLHFTDPLLERLRHKKVALAHVTLHVGLGTFKPISTERVEDHPMHAEYYQLDDANADTINLTVRNNRRIIAVGTTSVRTLESLAAGRAIQPGAGWTNLFITPGCSFQLVDALITNFHLPRTSLLALVCAFAGTENTLNAYRNAVENEYRFYSYGDAMLIT